MPHRSRPIGSRRNAAALASLLIGALLAACGASGSEPGSADEPEQEGITVYSGRIPPLVGPAIDSYEAEVDRDVQVRFGDSAPLAATILEEGDNTPADVFFSQDAGALGALESEGRLARLPRDILRRVEPRFRSDQERWVGISGRARVIAYGPEVEHSELPDSVLELTDERWRGRVGWAPPNASLQAYVTALRDAQGEDVARDWLEGMVANDARQFDSNTPIRDAIAAGEIDVGLINHYYVAQAIAEQGPDYPVKLHFPAGDLGSLINVAGVGVLESSDRKREAFEFVRSMLSRPSQRYFAESTREYPLVDAVRAPEGVAPLAEIPSPSIDLSRISDLEGTLELLRETGAL